MGASRTPEANHRYKKFFRWGRGWLYIHTLRLLRRLAIVLRRALIRGVLVHLLLCLP